VLSLKFSIVSLSIYLGSNKYDDDTTSTSWFLDSAIGATLILHFQRGSRDFASAEDAVWASSQQHGTNVQA
jgi:hypothetical protein